MRLNLEDIEYLKSIGSPLVAWGQRIGIFVSTTPDRK